MSRGGRGGFRGRGGGSSGGGSNVPPLGVTFADLQALPKEGSPLYPPLDSMPVLARVTDAEREVCHRQVGFTERLRCSAYYIMSQKKDDDLERYSDRFKPTARLQATLSLDILNKDFFPPSLWEAHFNPKPKRSTGGLTSPKRRKKKTLVDWSTLEAQTGDNAGEGEEGSGSQAGEDEDAVEEVDYDQEDEDYNDNDYENNYFNNGEDDNDEDLGDGAIGRDGGGDED